MEVKSEFNKIWYAVKENINLFRKDPMMIAPYLSHANQSEIIIRGRVLEDENIVVDENDNRWENLINSIKRLETDEAAHTTVIVNYKNIPYTTITDHEGYFELSIKTDIEPTQEGGIEWSKLYAYLPEYLDESDNPISNEVRIMKPHNETKFGVIIDIDDTILQSHVNSFLKLRLLYETLFKNSSSRMPFDGISDALNTISKGGMAYQINPIFYLSHSPWNLFDLLHNFLLKNNIPEGPFFLRDFGYKKGREKYEYKNHKFLTIEHLMNFYSDMSFVLIGDATEKDIDIYLKAYKNFPNRVIKIIIRAADDEKRNERVRYKMNKNPHIPTRLITESSEIETIMKEYY